MNPELPNEAIEFAAAAAKAFSALGGVDAARRAEDDPSLRDREVAPVLEALGVDDLDPRADDDSLVAAAALCEAAGRVVLPYPLPSVLLADGDGRPFVVVPERRPQVDHGELFDRWRMGTLTRSVVEAAPTGAALGTRLGPFVTDLSPTGGAAADGERDALLHLTLTGWQILGTLDRAVELAVDHVTTRVQFGKPISAFQAVQFQLADCAVVVAGLRELARFTLWRVACGEGALPDVLALRTHALDVARTVLRSCQQLHGAAGVCDEYEISVLARHVQPALRLPWGAERTATELAGAIAIDGFEGLFPHGQAAR